MTINDVAKLAGVSPSTVSKIVNNKAANINSETIERVLKIVKEYHYSPYGFAINTSKTKTFILGVLFRSVSNPVLLEGIVHAAQESGYSILIHESAMDTKTELKNITSLCSCHIDGLLWEPVNDQSLEFQKQLTDQSIPYFYLNSYSNENALCLDFTKAGYALAKKLIDYHHSNIGFVYSSDRPENTLLFNGYKACLFDNHLPLNQMLHLLSSDSDLLPVLLAQSCSAILCADKESELAVYNQISSYHYRIPDDFSVISMRDSHTLPIGLPRVSAMYLPYYQFGEEACHTLIAKCENQVKLKTKNLFSPRPEFIDPEASVQIFRPDTLKRIIVVGSINKDTTLNVQDLPSPGNTTFTLSSAISPGGKGLNQSIGIAKLGQKVAIIGKLGNDYDASIIIDVFRKEKVSTEGLSRNYSEITGKAYIYVPRDTESTITVTPGANQTLTSSDVMNNAFLFKQCSYCLVSTEIPIETAITAVKEARKEGAKTIVKPATLGYLPKELLISTDIFVPNRKEATALAPNLSTVEEQAEFFLKCGASAVIITLGHSGCYLKTSSTSKYYKASNLVSVDSTGGADAFIAALSAYLTKGYNLDQAIQIATYAAGFCVSRVGVYAALVDQNTLENYIHASDPSLLNSEISDNLL